MIKPGGKSKSVIVDKGETQVNCLSYIDLNPLRAAWLAVLKTIAGIRLDIIFKPKTKISFCLLILDLKNLMSKAEKSASEDIDIMCTKLGH